MTDEMLLLVDEMEENMQKAQEAMKSDLPPSGPEKPLPPSSKTSPWNTTERNPASVTSPGSPPRKPA